MATKTFKLTPAQVEMLVTSLEFFMEITKDCEAEDEEARLSLIKDYEDAQALHKKLSK